MSVIDPQKTIYNGSSYEWFPAEVLSVDFSGKNKEKLYTVTCRMHGAFGSQSPYDVINARAMDANLKNIPIAGEIILVTKGPTAYSSAAGTSQEYYYTNPLSVQSSIHHNGLPGLTYMLEDKSPRSESSRKDAQDGLTNKVKERLDVPKKIDRVFAERLDVYPIQPYSGDIILEGRWGQSIRFGSTIDERRDYPQKPSWKKGLGETGNPILILSNGTNPKSLPFNEFILENIDEDDSSIWMTSGQYVKFKPASEYTPSITSKEIDLYTKNEYGGNSVIIASDRIIFNAKKQEILAFSKEGIGFSSEKGISLDGKQVVEIESGGKISLGINAVQPILLGRKTMDWMNDLCNVLLNLVSAIMKQTHPTGTGPSGIPINVGDFSTIKSQLHQVISDINKLPSQLAFVNEKPGGPSQEEVQQEKQNKGKLKPSNFAKQGDRPTSLTDGKENMLMDGEDTFTLVAEISQVEGEKLRLMNEVMGEETITIPSDLLYGNVGSSEEEGGPL